MTHPEKTAKVWHGKGFIAALDQSGGSTPKALAQYGVPETAFSNEDEMYKLVHDMRTRIITAPSFSGQKIIGAILFEKTMDEKIEGQPSAEYLWQKKGVVPFLKIDKGLADEQDNCQMMKSIPKLESLLLRGLAAGMYGTKMRSTINKANENGIANVVQQQFEFADEIMRNGLMPIIEPEVNIKATDKLECEKILKAQILKHLNKLHQGQKIMLKLTLPEQRNFYSDLIGHDKVLRTVALSGGYSLDESCDRLAQNDGMIASFSRALTNDLKITQQDDEFNMALGKVIDKIYNASVNKAAYNQAA